MTGGAAALAAIIMLGPRRRRVNPDGTLKALNPHSMPMASLGTFILIFGETREFRQHLYFYSPTQTHLFSGKGKVLRL